MNQKQRSRSGWLAGLLGILSSIFAGAIPTFAEVAPFDNFYDVADTWAIANVARELGQLLCSFFGKILDFVEEDVFNTIFINNKNFFLGTAGKVFHGSFGQIVAAFLIVGLVSYGVWIILHNEQTNNSGRYIARQIIAFLGVFLLMPGMLGAFWGFMGDNMNSPLNLKSGEGIYDYTPRRASANCINDNVIDWFWMAGKGAIGADGKTDGRSTVNGEIAWSAVQKKNKNTDSEFTRQADRNYFTTAPQTGYLGWKMISPTSYMTEKSAEAYNEQLNPDNIEAVKKDLKKKYYNASGAQKEKYLAEYAYYNNLTLTGKAGSEQTDTGNTTEGATSDGVISQAVLDHVFLKTESGGDVSGQKAGVAGNIWSILTERGFENMPFYRWTIDWIPLIAELAALSIFYLAIALKILRIMFDTIITGVVAPLFVAIDFWGESGQRTKTIYRSLVNAMLSIGAMLLEIEFFTFFANGMSHLGDGLTNWAARGTLQALGYAALCYIGVKGADVFKKMNLDIDNSASLSAVAKAGKAVARGGSAAVRKGAGLAGAGVMGASALHDMRKAGNFSALNALPKKAALAGADKLTNGAASKLDAKRQAQKAENKAAKDAARKVKAAGGSKEEQDKAAEQARAKVRSLTGQTGKTSPGKVPLETSAEEKTTENGKPTNTTGTNKHGATGEPTAEEAAALAQTGTEEETTGKSDKVKKPKSGNPPADENNLSVEKDEEVNSEPAEEGTGGGSKPKDKANSSGTTKGSLPEGVYKDENGITRNANGTVFQGNASGLEGADNQVKDPLTAKPKSEHEASEAVNQPTEHAGQKEVNSAQAETKASGIANGEQPADTAIPEEAASVDKVEAPVTPGKQKVPVTPPADNVQQNTLNNESNPAPAAAPAQNTAGAIGGTGGNSGGVVFQMKDGELNLRADNVVAEAGKNGSVNVQNGSGPSNTVEDTTNTALNSGQNDTGGYAGYTVTQEHTAADGSTTKTTVTFGGGGGNNSAIGSGDSGSGVSSSGNSGESEKPMAGETQMSAHAVGLAARTQARYGRGDNAVMAQTAADAYGHISAYANNLAHFNNTIAANTDEDGHVHFGKAIGEEIKTAWNNKKAEYDGYVISGHNRITRDNPKAGSYEEEINLLNQEDTRPGADKN